MAVSLHPATVTTCIIVDVARASLSDKLFRRWQPSGSRPVGHVHPASFTGHPLRGYRDAAGQMRCDNSVCHCTVTGSGTSRGSSSSRHRRGDRSNNRSSGAVAIFVCVQLRVFTRRLS
jgi:hypothetical protein